MHPTKFCISEILGCYVRTNIIVINQNQTHKLRVNNYWSITIKLLILLNVAHSLTLLFHIMLMAQDIPLNPRFSTTLFSSHPQIRKISQNHWPTKWQICNSVEISLHRPKWCGWTLLLLQGATRITSQSITQCATIPTVLSFDQAQAMKAQRRRTGIALFFL
jgi:hypothetical protein